jgi:integrase
MPRRRSRSPGTSSADSGAQQQLLRHASSKTTTEIYSHVTAAQERQAADVLEAAVAG